MPPARRTKRRRGGNDVPEPRPRNSAYGRPSKDTSSLADLDGDTIEARVRIQEVVTESGPNKYRIKFVNGPKELMNSPIYIPKNVREGPLNVVPVQCQPVKPETPFEPPRKRPRPSPEAISDPSSTFESTESIDMVSPKLARTSAAPTPTSTCERTRLLSTRNSPGPESQEFMTAARRSPSVRTRWQIAVDDPSMIGSNLCCFYCMEGATMNLEALVKAAELVTPASLDIHCTYTAEHGRLQKCKTCRETGLATCFQIFSGLMAGNFYDLLAVWEFLETFILKDENGSFTYSLFVRHSVVASAAKIARSFLSVFKMHCQKHGMCPTDNRGGHRTKDAYHKLVRDREDKLKVQFPYDARLPVNERARVVSARCPRLQQDNAQYHNLKKAVEVCYKSIDKLLRTKHSEAEAHRLMSRFPLKL